MNIIRDIANGALPLAELPAFLCSLIGRTFWYWFAVLVAAFVIVAVTR